MAAAFQALLAPVAPAGAEETASPVETGVPGSPPPADPLTYRIGADDELRITVFGDDRLSRTVRVRPDGFIDLPLVRSVRAAGLTPDQLAHGLRERLSVFLVAPVVAVTVTEANSFAQQVRVIGAVGEPQAIPYETGMRMVDLLARIGGLNPIAHGNGAVIVRGGQSIPVRLGDLVENRDTRANIALEPGDILIVPEGFFAGTWQREFAVTVGTAFTDNYDLDPSGEEDEAVISSVTPRVTISGEGARFRGALAAAVNAQYVALTDSGATVLPEILGSSTTELSRDTLYLDAAASVAHIQVDAAAPTSSEEGNETNRALVQTYQVSPYLITRLHDVAYVETRYLVAGTIADSARTSDSGSSADVNDTLSDSITNALQVRLSSPPEQQSRLRWGGLAYGALVQRFDVADVTVAGANVQPEVQVSRSLALLSQAGYGTLDVGDDTLSGPDLAAGLRYVPSPAIAFRAIGGWRLEHPQADGLLRWTIGPTTSLTARYTDTVGVGQTALVQNLAGVGFDPETRRFVNRDSGLGFQAAPSGANVDDDLTRSQQFQLSLNKTYHSNRFDLAGYYTRQQLIEGAGSTRSTGSGGEAAASDQTSWGVTAGFIRPLNQATTGSIRIGFFQIEPDGGGETTTEGGEETGRSRDVFARLDLSYALSEAVSLSGGYGFRRRFGEDSDDSFTENVFAVSVTQRF
jgi:polysaccharide export outer membrane protein